MEELKTINNNNDDKSKEPCAFCKKIMPFWNWLESRFGLLTCMDNYCKQTYSKGWSCLRVLSSTIAFAVFVQVITGFVMWLSYSANAGSAWESVFNIQNNVTFGWLLRGIHHFSAQVLVATCLIYIIKMILVGAYKVPREVIFWLAIFMFFFALGACLTGDLLRWDQNSLAATQVRTKYLLLLPFIGEPLYKLALGGAAFSTLTLTRFLALHIGVFGGGFIVLLFLHGWVWYRAADQDKLGDVPACPCHGCKPDAPKVKFWPGQCLRNAIGWTIFMAIVLGLVFHFGQVKPGVPAEPGMQYGAELGSPASTNPMDALDAARPEWSFRGLYEYTLRLQGVPEFVLIYCITGALAFLFFIMPFTGRVKILHAFNVCLTLGLLAVAVWLTYSSYARDAKDESYLAAWEQDETEALRVSALIKEKGGIHPNGALFMVKNDWVLQGPKIYSAQCASCHSMTDAEGKGIVCQTPSAPNLYKYGTRDWIAGWLDAKTIKSDAYFGKTKFANGTMVKEIVKMENDINDLLKSDDEVDREDGQDMVKAKNLIIDVLTAEANLTAPRKVVNGVPEGVPEGFKDAFDTLSCANCHQFYGMFKPKSPAVDLTGYASFAWTKDLTANVGDAKFYGAENDRMPCYGPEGVLTAKEIEMVSKWLKAEAEKK